MLIDMNNILYILKDAKGMDIQSNMKLLHFSPPYPQDNAQFALK